MYCRAACHNQMIGKLSVAFGRLLRHVGVVAIVMYVLFMKVMPARTVVVWISTRYASTNLFVYTCVVGTWGPLIVGMVKTSSQSDGESENSMPLYGFRPKIRCPFLCYNRKSNAKRRRTATRQRAQLRTHNTIDNDRAQKLARIATTWRLFL